MFPLFQPSKYRKIPFRAHGVSTVVFCVLRLLTISPFQSPKKNVLFLTIGPPRLAVYSCVLVQSGRVGFQAPVFESIVLLLAQVLASKAELVADHTRLPEYRFVPERVRNWIWALPRPNSASTGARIM